MKVLIHLFVYTILDLMFSRNKYNFKYKFENLTR